eukprot:COSAG01_NODE_970_length_12375_cov_27.268736_7_plen_77_part_00
MRNINKNVPLGGQLAMAPLNPFPGLTCTRGQISGTGRAGLGWVNSCAQVSRALKAWDDMAERGSEQRAKTGGRKRA